MNNSNYEIYFDCGSSRLRAGAFNKVNLGKNFYAKSEFLFDHTNIDIEIQKIITSLEKNTNGFISNINLMIDSPNMLTIGISIPKKIDGSRLREEDIQFLVQETKQQITKSYTDHNITHIIINNYKINNIDYNYLPEDIDCKHISLDIIFICLPNETINYFKSLFNKFEISINKIISSSYTKAVNYKANLSSNKDVSFVDVGFDKTSVISYVNNNFQSLVVLPIGGNHITKDISKILKVDLKQAEKLKLNFDNDEYFLNDNNFSIDLIQKIIFARTEEILELCAKSIRLNFNTTSQFKMVMMGEGSKILDNRHRDKISFSSDIDFLEEFTEDICQSGFNSEMGLNNQEVVIIPKKLIKLGFFEKLFYFFK